MAFAIGATIGFTGILGTILVVGIIFFFIGRFIWDMIWLAWYEAWYEPRRIRQKAIAMLQKSEEERQWSFNMMLDDEKAKVTRRMEDIVISRERRKKLKAFVTDVFRIADAFRTGRFAMAIC